MPDVDLRVAGLHERAEHQVGEEARLGFALEPLDEPLEIPGAVLSLVAFERVAERQRELGEFLDLPRVGLFVDPVEGRAAGLGQLLGDGFVGQQHELLDDAVGDVALGREDARHPAALVEPDVGFGEVEVDGSAPVPPLRTGSGRVRASAPTWGRVPRSAASPRGLGRPGCGRRTCRSAWPSCGAPLRRTCDRRRSPSASTSMIAGENKPVLVGIQAADAAGELRRKHRDGAVGEVDGGASLVRVAVEGGAFVHVMRHVRDVHPQQPVSVRQAAAAIWRRRSRAPSRRRSSPPARFLKSSRPAISARRTRSGILSASRSAFGAEPGGQPELVLNDPVLDARVAGVAEHLDHLALGFLVPARRHGQEARPRSARASPPWSRSTGCGCRGSFALRAVARRGSGGARRSAPRCSETCVRAPGRPTLPCGRSSLPAGADRLAVWRTGLLREATLTRTRSPCIASPMLRPGMKMSWR